MKNEVSKGVVVTVIVAVVAVVCFIGFRVFTAGSHSGPAVSGKDYASRMAEMKAKAASSGQTRPEGVTGGPRPGNWGSGMQGGRMMGSGMPGGR